MRPDRTVATSRNTLIVAVAVSGLVLAGCAPRHTVTPPTAAQPIRSSQKSLPVDPRALASQIGFPETLVSSIQAHGTKLRRLIGSDAEYNAKPAAGLVIDVSGGDWHQAVEDLRRKVGPGYQVFCFDQGFSYGPNEIAVLRAKDQFDILRAVGTSAPNYDIGPEKVLARVLVWDKAYGLDIVGAGDDWLEAKFRRAPADMDAFAREVYKFCPDVVDQGTETVEKLASEIKESNSVFLWWD